MNRALQRGKALGEIAVLRGISTRMAEQQALQAQRALLDAEREREHEREQLTDVIAQWDVARNATRFDPMTLTAWGVAVNRQVEVVAQSDTAVTERGVERDSADAAHALAGAAERCADMLLRRTRQRLARHREEIRMADLDDANTRRMLVR